MRRAGQILSFSLVLFAFALFYLLFISRDTTAITQIDSRVWGLLQFTLYQAFLSTLLSIMIGVLLAWSLAHTHFKGKELLVAIFSSSLVLPTLVVVFGLISIYGRNGWINSLFDGAFGSYLYGLFGILLAHVYLNASYASRALLHAFEAIPSEKYKLAKSLGFGVMQRFLLVEFPAIKSTIVSIGATIFLLCFSSFAIVLVLGGSPSYNTLEVAIYEAVKLEFDIDMALKLALIQLSISTALVVLSASVKTKVHNLTHKVKQSLREPIMISILQVSLIVLFALFFISPFVAIMIDGFGADFSKIFGDSLFIKSFLTSIVLATISAILTLFFALALSDARRRSTGVGTLLIGFSGNLYLAIPSLVLGLGFFLLSQRLELSQIFIASIALITANVLMALPFALSILSPMMTKTAKRYDRLCASLGISGWRRWAEIELPYLTSSLAYIFALSFCFSLGDLGIIALFGSEDFSTLPWYLYGLLGSYRTSDAAGVALVMLVLVLVVFIGIPKLFKER